MIYRVHFQIAYGGFYYSESFTDERDADNLAKDILFNTDGVVRFRGIEVSDDNGETWSDLQKPVEAS